MTAVPTRASLAAAPAIITDGGIETRVLFETEFTMDPHVQVAAMVSDADGRRLLTEIYTAYVEAARAHALPVIIGTPTFRASANFVRAAGLEEEDAVGRLNRDAVTLHQEIRDRSSHEAVHIAGVLGPSGDAYRPEEALAADRASEYHRAQAEALAGAGADFLYAPTFPSVEEAAGAASAMAATGLPTVVSFVLGRDGRILDGTPLAGAIERIDAHCAPRPLFYSLSCIHPSVAARALDEAGEAAARVDEVKANSSRLSPAELVGLDHLEGDDPEPFADAMASLGERFDLRVLGGCCGTDDRHMRALAARIAGAGA